MQRSVLDSCDSQSGLDDKGQYGWKTRSEQYKWADILNFGALNLVCLKKFLMAWEQDRNINER